MRNDYEMFRYNNSERNSKVHQEAKDFCLQNNKDPVDDKPVCLTGFLRTILRNTSCKQNKATGAGIY